jgi:hypothetical protein
LEETLSNLCVVVVALVFVVFNSLMLLRFVEMVGESLMISGLFEIGVAVLKDGVEMVRVARGRLGVDWSVGVERVRVVARRAEDEKEEVDWDLLEWRKETRRETTECWLVIDARPSQRFFE